MISYFYPLSVKLWPHLVAPTTFLLLFTLPPFPLRRLLYLAAFIALSRFSWIAPYAPESPWARYALATAWMHYLGWFAKMILHTPEHDFWREDRPPHEAETMSFGWKKLQWACGLLGSPRGVGWNRKITVTPPPRQKLAGRRWFVLHQVLRAAAFTVLFSLSAEIFLEQHAKLEDSYWKAALTPLAAVEIWSETEVWFALWNAALVHMGWAEEKDFLSLFGNITAVDSLRGFWGNVWHQNFRMMFEDFAHFVGWTLRVRHGTWLFWLVEVWTASLISGTVYGLVPPRGQFVLEFALLQAVGLTVECLFLDTPARDITLYEFGLEDERMMGRWWTFGWLLMSAYQALDAWAAVDQHRWSWISVARSINSVNGRFR